MIVFAAKIVRNLRHRDEIWLTDVLIREIGRIFLSLFSRFLIHSAVTDSVDLSGLMSPGRTNDLIFFEADVIRI